MHLDALAMLACPHCGEGLTEGPGLLRCEKGHSFDVARQGYVNLLAHEAKSEGDSAEMVAARAEFLERGHLAPVMDAVAASAARVLAETGAAGGVIELGGGTGAYLAAVLEGVPDRAGLALDVSRYAARRAARAHPRAAAAVCDVWAGLPVRDGAAALALSVFAPRNGREIARVLAPGGAALVVTPTDRHLRELVEPLGLVRVADSKRDRVERAMLPLRPSGPPAELELEWSLDRRGLELLVAMGPSARHVDLAGRGEDLDALAGRPVTASVELAEFAQA